MSVKDIDKGVVWKAQMAALRDMEISIKSLIKAAQETQNRIQTVGLNNNYSINHDCYNYAVQVWKSSLRLAELKKLEYDLTGRDPWGMPKKDKTQTKKKLTAKNSKKQKTKKK